jgi:hypothetical protein
VRCTQTTSRMKNDSVPTVLVHKMQKPEVPEGPPAQLAARKAIVSAISHATITNEATAPAVIRAFSLRVVGRSMSDDAGRSVLDGRPKPSRA